MTLQLTSLTGPAVLPYAAELARLRIEVFREYPYLYDGTLEYESRYLATYAQSPESLFILARDGERIVGVSTGVPLRDEDAAFQAPFREAGYDPGQIFYFGESVISRDYRGLGTGAEFFRLREAYARSLTGMKWALFCAVDRPDDHPARPAGYRPLDEFWQRMGYQRHPSLKTYISWRELGQQEETPKPLSCWFKALDERDAG